MQAVKDSVRLEVPRPLIEAALAPCGGPSSHVDDYTHLFVAGVTTISWLLDWE